jgi:hypothetical protein
MASIHGFILLLYISANFGRVPRRAHMGPWKLGRQEWSHWHFVRFVPLIKSEIEMLN